LQLLKIISDLLTVIANLLQCASEKNVENWSIFDAVMTKTNGGDTQSRKLRKKLAQVSCTSFLHQIFVQVHADDTSNKKGHSWTKQITFSILSVDHSMGTQNFYLNNSNKFKK